MMIIIAFRNLSRHRVKTILTACAIMVSVAVFIFLNCWLGGTKIESRRNIVQFEMGAAKLQTKLYFEKKDEMPSYENFLNWEKYQKALADAGYYSAPRYVFSGTLHTLSGSIPMLFHGIDPFLESQTMRWTEYIEFGRMVGADSVRPNVGAMSSSPAFEIVMGNRASERLKVGIPTRPLRLELESLISEIVETQYIESKSEDDLYSVSNSSEIKDFIRSLYTPLGKRGFWDLVQEPTTQGNERLILRKDIAKADLDRYWDMIANTGRNELRINAVIDIKAVPETIRKDRFEVELMEALREEDKELVRNAYEYVEVMGAYLLKDNFNVGQANMLDNNDETRQTLSLLLDAMIRAGFSGAVRNVFQVIDVVVVGIINSPAPLPNGHVAYMPLDILQDEAGMMLSGAVTELVIIDSKRPLDKMPSESESSATITSVIEKSLGESLPENLAIYTWQEYMEDYLGYEQLQLGMPNMMVALLFLISFLGISNTILMAIMERTKETGMMRAMGMTDGQMTLVYMLEAGFIGLIGSILGIIVGCVFNYPIVKHGVDFSAMADIMGADGSIGFRVVGEFRSVWDFSVIIGTGIVATLLSFLIAYFPVKKALKLSITDSLRFE